MIDVCFVLGGGMMQLPW